MIEAVYAVNEYIQDALNDANLTIGNLYPGYYAPASENSNKFALYNVTINDIYELKGLKQASITYTMYNVDFDEIHRIGQVIRDTLNVENIQNETLTEVIDNDPNPDTVIRFLETSVIFTGDGQASFVDGKDYFLQNFEVRVLFTVDT